MNGVRISQPNACQARNGVVHIIDDVLPFSSATINDVLTDQSSRFSTFQQLAEEAGIAELLDVLKKSRTVFAPTNDAFDNTFVDCLLNGTKKDLSTFVLIHISYPAEFTATLSERRYVPTFTYWSLKVTSTDEGVSITKGNIPLDDTDIPARNGVIHAIPEIIQPFNDRQLERICPGITATMEPATPPSVVETEVSPDPEVTAEPEVTPDPGTPTGGVVVTPDPDGIPPGGVVVPPESVGR